MVTHARRGVASAVASTLLLTMMAPRAVTHAAPSGSELSVPMQEIGSVRPTTVPDLLTLRVIGGISGNGLSVSPDGRYVAFELHQADLENNTYRVAWFIASTARRGIPQNVGDAGDPVLFRATTDIGYITGAWTSEKAAWSLDSEWIVYRRMVGNEIQLWRSRRDGGRQEQLTHNAADVERFQWSRDGTRILFAVDASRAEKRAANQKLADTGYLFDVNNYWWTSRGSPFFARYSLTGGKPHVWAYEWAAGVERKAVDAEVAEFEIPAATGGTLASLASNARVVAIRADGEAIAWLSPAFADKQGWQPPLTLHSSLSGAHAEGVRCSAQECTGMIDDSNVLSRGLWWSADGRQIYFARRVGANYGRTVLYAWRPGRKGVRQILETDDWISDCSQVGSKALCFRETPTKPRTVIAIDLRTGGIDTVVDPNPEFDLLQLGKVTRLEWSDSNDVSTFGYLVTPRDRPPGMRLPLIFVGYRAKYDWHGGGGNEYPVHVFAANGFAVLVYDMPDPWELYATISDPTGMELRRREEAYALQVPLSSLEAVIGHLDSQGIIDPSRVGITGFSSGAALAGYALVNSNHFGAAAVSSLVYNPISYYLTPGDASWRSILREMGLGRLHGSDDQAWPRVSLAMNASRVDTPLLINASDDEYLEAMQALVIFAEEGKPIEMHVYPDEYHVKWQPRHRYSVYVRNVDWFNFWLRSYENPDAAKLEQYVRWRRLRSATRSQTVTDAIPQTN